jgi:tetratricopeptide (TPR) repeat protein
VVTDFEVAILYFEASLAKYQQLDEPFFLARSYIRLGYCSGDKEMAKFMEFTQKGLDLALDSGNKMLAATALINLGSGGFGAGDYDQVEKKLNQGIAMAEQIGDRITQAHGPMLLGLYYLLRGDFDQAYLKASNALAIADEIRFKVTMGYALGILSAQASLTGDPSLGLELGQRSIMTPSNPFGESIGNWALAIANCAAGNYDESREIIRQIVNISLRVSWPGVITWVIPLEAIIQANEGGYEQATQYLSLGINHPLSPRGWVEKWDVLLMLRENLVQELGETVFQEHWELGRNLDLEETARLLIESAEGS